MHFYKTRVLSRFIFFELRILYGRLFHKRFFFNTATVDFDCVSSFIFFKICFKPELCLNRTRSAISTILKQSIVCKFYLYCTDRSVTEIKISLFLYVIVSGKVIVYSVTINVWKMFILTAYGKSQSFVFWIFCLSCLFSFM